ncbi:MAG: hypothetical protein AAF737_04625 [Pseudomonadota bacterium]
MPLTNFTRTIAIAAAATAILSGPATAITKDQERQAFLTADADGSRTLDKREFRTFLNTLADMGLPVAKRVRTFGVYGIAFGRSDFNKDGILTPDELLKANSKFRNAGANFK